MDILNRSDNEEKSGDCITHLSTRKKPQFMNFNVVHYIIFIISLRILYKTFSSATNIDNFDNFSRMTQAIDSLKSQNWKALGNITRQKYYLGGTQKKNVDNPFVAERCVHAQSARPRVHARCIYICAYKQPQTHGNVSTNTHARSEDRHWFFGSRKTPSTRDGRVLYKNNLKIIKFADNEIRTSQKFITKTASVELQSSL